MSSSSNFKTPLPMGEGLGVRLLKQYWGYDTFRGIQEDIINSITEGRDTLGLMPTGGGKSITFQVPALAKEGACHLLRHEQAGNHRHTGELYIRQFQVPLHLPRKARY